MISHKDTRNGMPTLTARVRTPLTPGPFAPLRQLSSKTNTPPSERRQMLSISELGAFRIFDEAVQSTAEPSFEGVDPRNGLPKNERVDVVRTFVGVHALQIRHVAHRRVLGQNAVRPEKAACLARDVSRHAHVVALRQGHLLRSERPSVFQSPEMNAEQLALYELGQHSGQSLLLQLE